MRETILELARAICAPTEAEEPLLEALASAAEAELPQRDPDGVVKFTESQYGATNQIAQVWLEGNDVWLKTPDQACKRVRDADDEMRQVLQKQSEEVKQLQKG